MAVDVGFGGLVEKFEEYFGKPATRILLMLIGMAVAAACMGAIWEWLLSPLLAFFLTPLWGETVGSLIWVAFTIGLGVAAGFWMIAAFRNWRNTRQLSKLTRRARALLGDAEESQAKARQLLDQTRESHSEADKATDVSFDLARVLISLAKEIPDDKRLTIEAELETLAEQREERKRMGLKRVSRATRKKQS